MNSRSKNITYCVVKETYTIKEKTRTSYGVVAFSETDQEDAQIIECVRDISSDEGMVLEMVELFNRFFLSPIHLYDAIEDFLNKR